MIFAIVIAFSMFSAIPMPRVEWSGKNMRYMMCAFPLVGVVIGALWFGAVMLAAHFFSEGGSIVARILGNGGLAFSNMNWAVLHVLPLVLVLIPVAVTGGIHVDGFMDTCDALGSHAGREKKLAIMKDSHCGAFSVIGCVLYLLANFVLAQALCREIFAEAGDMRTGAVVCVAAGFVLSRLLSAFAVAVFPIARDSGLVRTFSDSSAKRFTAAWCAVWFVVISLALVLCFRWQGISVACAQLVVFAWYFVLARRNFGGITGDTAGWFVQMAELAALFATVLVTGMLSA